MAGAADELKANAPVKMLTFWLTIALLVCATSSATGQLIFQTTTTQSPLGTSGSVPSPGAGWALVNNVRISNAITPFVTQPPRTQQFVDCFGSCPTTPEYNPICGSNMQLYLNEQKFNCARFCGADIQIVRRGSCEGLFQMTRG